MKYVHIYHMSLMPVTTSPYTMTMFPCSHNLSVSKSSLYGLSYRSPMHVNSRVVSIQFALTIWALNIEPFH